MTIPGAVADTRSSVARIPRAEKTWHVGRDLLLRGNQRQPALAGQRLRRCFASAPLMASMSTDASNVTNSPRCRTASAEIEISDLSRAVDTYRDTDVRIEQGEVISPEFVNCAGARVRKAIHDR